MTAVLVAAVLATGPVTMEPRPLPPVEILISRCVEHPTCTVAQVSAVAPASVGPQPSPPTTAPPPAETTPPPPSTPTATQPPGSGSGVERWRGLVSQFFPPGEVDTALGVMACESGGDPNAYNPSGASGLMQVLASWADNFGVLPDQLFDPETNIWIASELWADGGWGHWSQCLS